MIFNKLSESSAARYLRRREFLGFVPLGFLRAATTNPVPFPYTGLDHIEFTVSDVLRSRDFYGRVFGYDVMKNTRTQRRYVKVGESYLAFEPNTNVKVDHVSAGIAGFDVNKLHEFLNSRSIPYKDFPSGRDLNVSDGDGLRLQLSADNGWSQLTGATAAMEAFSGPLAPIKAESIAHVLLEVTDMGKAESFYRQILGPPADQDQAFTWFDVGRSRLGLRKAKDKPGIEHFCIRGKAARDARKRIEEAGATVTSSSPLQFRIRTAIPSRSCPKRWQL